ncbi:hypothetical protein GCM10009836_44720 [Pseudonocardia ailaonensis]|uniref:Uncharacterized protein n=1 Tax=Pseudonocardia ailaonensis TaxID=367279 RepID=A0ABN2NA84_9PSEU
MCWTGWCGQRAKPSSRRTTRPDTVEVVLTVPADKAARLRDLTKLWLEGRPNAEWRDTDHDLAVTLWEQLDDRRRRVLGVFIDHPGRRFRADELLDRTGDATSPTGLTSLLGQTQVLCEKLGRAWPWHFDYPAGRANRAVYWFEPEIAAMFEKVRRQYTRLHRVTRCVGLTGLPWQGMTARAIPTLLLVAHF